MISKSTMKGRIQIRNIGQETSFGAKTKKNAFVMPGTGDLQKIEETMSQGKYLHILHHVERTLNAI